MAACHALMHNIRKGKITTYIGDSDHKVTMFDYSPDLSFDKNLEFLKDFYGNNEAERAIKTWVLVRKNSLFAGPDDGAKAIVIVDTILPPLSATEHTSLRRLRK